MAGLVFGVVLTARVIAPDVEKEFPFFFTIAA